MLRTLALSFAVLAACSPPIDKPKPGDSGGDSAVDSAVPVDEDGDGQLVSEGDCDDNDAGAYLGATEVCDEVDNDCDGDVDEDAGDSWYADNDGDSYGDLAVVTQACTAPVGTVADSTDCDDSDATSFPGNAEICDGSDNDCDGATDEDGLTRYYVDADLDGYGDTDNALESCEPGDGTSVAGDCDDNDPDIFPGAPEYCDGEDDNCDGEIDESDALDASTFYADADGDSFGDPLVTEQACSQPADYVSNSDDCDDTDSSVYPDATEYCDGQDDDCDAAIDEDSAVDAGIWYADADVDGYGDLTQSAAACAMPSGYVADSSDCDDTDVGVNPGAVEVCDGEDDDCDAVVDDSAVDVATWYADTDTDGYGDIGTSATACSAPSGYVADATDCDDTDADTSPVALEYCNGEDDNCDGTTDEDTAVDVAAWYRDADLDTYGTPASALAACDVPSGYVGNDDDCDDTDAGISPMALEYCDGEDDNCDGTVDESTAVDVTTWYGDDDRDTFGAATSAIVACDLPFGYVANDDDCDDTDAGVSPVAVEYCDGEDDNCDGTVDETSAVDVATWYADIDGDRYGDVAAPARACSAPASHVADSTDCDDTNDTANPGASEVCDSVDNDCDAVVDENSAVDATVWYRDADTDGYGATTPTQTTCNQPTGYVDNADDCDDTDIDMNPGETDVCYDSIDSDCSGTADDGCPTYDTHCGTISASETWSAADVHFVTCDVSVQGAASPTLTIEDGATVYFYAGTQLRIGYGSYGALDADGSVFGITMTALSSTASAGYWDGLWIGAYNRDVYLNGVTLAYGGGNAYGNVYAAASATNSGALVITDSQISDSSNSGVYLSGNSELDMSGTVVSDNADYGVYLASTSSLETTASPTFTDNVITANGLYPISVPVAYVAELDDTSSYDCNGVDSVYVHTGTLSSSATWQNLDADYLFTGDVTVAGSSSPVLTIEDGARLEFNTGVGMNVGVSSYGGLTVQGTTAGVTFTSSATTPAAGGWDGLYFGGSTRSASIDGATIEYAGGNGYGNIYLYNTNNNAAVVEITDSFITDGSNSGIYATSTSLLAITDTLVADNADYGVFLDTYAVLDERFVGNELSGNGLYPISLVGNEVALLDDTSTYTGNTSDFIRVAADTVTEDGTWELLDVDYRITGDVNVGGTADPRVVLSDGTLLAFDTGARLSSGYSSYGTLVVQGTTLGVTLTTSETTPRVGAWEGLWIGTYDTGSTIDGAIIEYGGANTYANVYVTGNVDYGGSLTITDSIITSSSNSGVYLASTAAAEISDTLISDNTDYGVCVDSSSALSDSAGVAAFTDNEVTGNTLEPVRLYANQMAELDDSSTYLGNGEDRIYVTGETIATSQTWQNLDVPYYIVSDITVQASASPTLTVSPGADVTFGTSAGLLIGNSSAGALYAVGTESLAITFTSGQSTPAAGDWDGITLSDRETGSTIQYATVSYGATNLKGNIYLYSASSATVIDQCTVTDSSYYGIYRTSSTPTITNVTYASNSLGELY